MRKGRRRNRHRDICPEEETAKAIDDAPPERCPNELRCQELGRRRSVAIILQCAGACGEADAVSYADLSCYPTGRRRLLLQQLERIPPPAVSSTHLHPPSPHLQTNTHTTDPRLFPLPPSLSKPATFLPTSHVPEGQCDRENPANFKTNLQRLTQTLLLPSTTPSIPKISPFSHHSHPRYRLRAAYQRHHGRMTDSLAMGGFFWAREGNILCTYIHTIRSERAGLEQGVVAQAESLAQVAGSTVCLLGGGTCGAPPQAAASRSMVACTYSVVL